MRMSSNWSRLPKEIGWPGVVCVSVPVVCGVRTPKASSPLPIEKPFWRTTRPGSVRGVGRGERAAHAEAREGQRRAADAQQLLARGARRVVGDDDALAGQVGDVGDVGLERRDLQLELARHVDAEVAAEQAEGVDLDVEDAEHADQVDRRAGLRLLRGRRGGRRARAALQRALGAEVQRRVLDADGDRQDEHAVLEAHVGEADARALQRQRAERQRPGRRRRARRERVEPEGLHDALEVLASPPAS